MATAGGNSNTRVKLDKQANVRQVGTTYHYKLEGENAKTDIAVGRGAIVEYESGNDREHLLGLRLHHHDNQDKLYLLLAHFKTTGAALLLAECKINKDEDYNKDCVNANYTVSYYDQAKDEVKNGANTVPAGFKKTRSHFLVDVATAWTHGSYQIDQLNPEAAFFAGTGTTDANLKEFYAADLPTDVKAEQ